MGTMAETWLTDFPPKIDIMGTNSPIQMVIKAGKGQ